MRNSCKLWPGMVLIPVLLAACQSTPEPNNAAGTSIRVATFNIAMGLDHSGDLQRRLLDPADDSLRQVAAILQSVRPDVVLLNEFDFDPAVPGGELLQENFLSRSQFGQNPIDYPYTYTATVNTGVNSGLDLDGDGKLGGPGDAWGFGFYPGQYGMLLLSRWPIDEDQARSFQRLPWSAVPGARLPVHGDTGRSWYDEKMLPLLRLSSKSHWMLPVRVQDRLLQVIALHPTPPVFDGPEDRNGLRNADEIGLASAMATALSSGRPPAWLTDDRGRPLPQDPWNFVVLGDLNADPFDGASRPGAIQALLENQAVDSSCEPSSEGAVEASERQGGVNLLHQGPAGTDTADFDDRQVGNLRVDYALPSSGLQVTGCGVFWPSAGDKGSDWVGVSDHRLVWLDIALPD